MFEIDNKEILITGGTGSLGSTLVKLLKTKYKTKGIRIYSRSELTQSKFKTELINLGISDGIEFIIGDVRDRKSLERATRGVDVIINCSALKRVEVCEANPIECKQTNIQGAENVVHAALKWAVWKVFQISTDKAVYPTTLYGKTKAVAEDIIMHSSIYSQCDGIPHFSCARYGNVFGSNGSVIQLFKQQAESGTLTITDFKMTRFWILLQDVAQFILDRIEDMEGGEIFIPNMPSMSVVEIAKTIAPGAKLKDIGIRGQEKIHETLITKEESRYTKTTYPLMSNDQNDAYANVPGYWTITKEQQTRNNLWSFESSNNKWQLTRDELRKWLDKL